MNKKASTAGILILWLGSLFCMFLVTVLYIVLSSPYDTLVDTFDADIAPDHVATWDKLQQSWNEWPVYFNIAILFGAVIGTFLLSRDQVYY